MNGFDNAHLLITVHTCVCAQGLKSQAGSWKCLHKILLKKWILIKALLLLLAMNLIYKAESQGRPMLLLSFGE